MGFTLKAENFRGLRKIDWSPDGVCALVGPNGAGKTTLLAALDFLRIAYVHKTTSAVELQAGSAMMRNVDAPASEPVRLAFARTSHDHGRHVEWEIQPRPTGVGIETPVVERLRVDGRIVISQDGGADAIDFDGQKFPADASRSALLRIYLDDKKEYQNKYGNMPFGPLLNYRFHESAQVHQLRATGSRATAETALDHYGENLFSVLRNWQAGKRTDRERLDFVKSGLARAFPDLSEDIDFEVAGQTVAARFYRPGSRQPVPAYAAPNGLLTGMIALTAIASAEPHAIIAIDEPENGLHPHAIAVLVEMTRERAAERNLDVIFATHSPVVLNQFNSDPSHVWIIEGGNSPMRLDEHENREWLAQFSLGDLYANLDIGAPKTTMPPTGDPGNLPTPPV